MVLGLWPLVFGSLGSNPKTQGQSPKPHSYFLVLSTLSGLTSPQLCSVPCSSSAFNSAAVCICKFGSSTVSGVDDESEIARFTASRPCLNNCWSKYTRPQPSR